MNPIADIPALLIGLMAGFYWGRVIKLVFKTRRLTGKAANFLPPEKLGAFLRIIWYPTVVLWILIPLACAFIAEPNRPDVLQSFWFSPLIKWPAVAVAFAAWYFTLICWRKMGRDWRMGIDPEEKNTLIVSGPYAYARHPIYALSSLLMLMSFVAVPNTAMAVLACVHLLFLQWEARREERHMAGVHGETYRNYMRQVGRFVPRGRYHPPATSPTSV